MSSNRKESPWTGFVHLHVHSSHSLLAGTASIPKLVRRTKELGYPALALTDTNSGAGLILFLEECRKQGIQPILGVEWKHEKDENDSLVLLAKNAHGYGELCQLTTKFLCSKSKKPLYQFFEKHSENLFVLSSYPATLYAMHQTPMAPQLFGELVANSKESRQRSSEVESMADHLKIPLVATGDVYLLEKEEWNLHRVLRAVATNQNLAKVTPETVQSPLAYLKSAEDMSWIFQRRTDAVRNTLKIWQSCVDDLQQQPWIMPRLPNVPEGAERDMLRRYAMEGLENYYGGTKEYDKALERLEKELRIIHEKGYDAYFLMVRELRLWANEHFSTKFRKPKDCTTLRGSAANSLTLYCIGGSDLDPIRYNLYFERFLNPDRQSPPDVDLDFGWDERGEVLQRVFSVWGVENVAIMCTTNRFKWKSAFRVVAKVFGYHPDFISTLIQRIGVDAFFPGSAKIKNTVRDPKLEEIHHYAQLLIGRPHHLSQHCGGVIVTNEPIASYLVCQPSPGDPNRMITQIDMHSGIDFLGLIKFDFLGNGSLSVLRDTLEQLEMQGEEDPQVWDLEKCFKDPGVGRMLMAGESRGVFYLESPAQSRLNLKAQVGSFAEIGITSSLIRPAGTGYANTFIERNRQQKNGLKNWEFLHPSLEPILGETHDVCVYQEDIIRICVEIAGLSFKQADRVRKMMNSMHEGVPDDYEKIRRAFKEGCVEKSAFNRQQAETLWARIESFQGFSFCKSHSLSYAQLSYQCAYLKVHYPAQFLAAVVSNEHGFYGRNVYLDEAKRCGVQVLGPCVNRSYYKYWGQGQELRFGLMHLRGVRKDHLQRLLKERELGGAFRSFGDFVLRTPFFRKSEVQSLIYAGAMQQFGANGQVLMKLWHTLKENNGNGQLAAMFYEEARSLRLRFPKNRAELLEKEYGVADYFFSTDLLDELRNCELYQRSTPVERLRFAIGRKVFVLGFPIARRSHRVEGSGKTMVFLTLQDKTGVVDVVIWPSKWEEFKSKLRVEGSVLEIFAEVKEEFGAVCLELESVENRDWREILQNSEQTVQNLGLKAV